MHNQQIREEERAVDADRLNYLRLLFSDLLCDERGQDLIEYALVALLIALGATAAMKTLATDIGIAFSSVSTRLNSAV
jgi:pilus assembly protein Flp/PilA